MRNYYVPKQTRNLDLNIYYLYYYGISVHVIQCNYDSLAMHLVHIDLKGAPPNLAYWSLLCAQFRDWGDVDGLLIEWEDSWKFTAHSSALQFTYSRQDAQNMVAIAKQNGLAVVPLIQTFGHMEHVLKQQKYAYLREHVDKQDCLLPIECEQDKSFGLITSLIDDIFLTFGDSTQAIHLGGDEVWHLGTGPRSMERIVGQGEEKSDLYLKHYTFVVDYINKSYPGKQILLWDDMLRCIQDSKLAEYSLFCQAVQLVIWQYAAEPQQHLPPGLMEKYAKCFPQGFWAGTAFKGATGSCAQLPDISMHVKNHLNWSQLVEVARGGTKNVPNLPAGLSFHGYILTGWQRYDHFASLCELLPCGIPSLRCCLTALTCQKFEAEEVEKVKLILGLPEIPIFQHKTTTTRTCSEGLKFPGAQLYCAMQTFVNLQQSVKALLGHDCMTTWLSDWQVEHQRVSNVQVKSILGNLSGHIQELQSMQTHMCRLLCETFDKTTCDEWIGTYIVPLVKRLAQKQEKALLCAV